MSSHQNLAAPESNERRGKDLLTHEQKADLLHYIAPLTRLHSNAIRFTNGFPQSRKRLCPSDSKRNLTARHFVLRTAVKDATLCVSAEFILTFGFLSLCKYFR